MFEILLLDLDDTILDFSWARRQALQRTLTRFALPDSPEIRKLFARLDRDCWSRLERGELTRQQVREVRFRSFLEELGLDGDPLALSDSYVEFLAQGHCFLPGAQEAVRRLSESCRLFLVTNSTVRVQQGRLKSADLYRYFEDIFISEQVGAGKPSVEFFNHCFARIPGFRREAALIVGDSLTTDIRGGKNAGIATCWINPTDQTPPKELTPDYQIPSLTQLEGLLSAVRNGNKT